MMEQQDWTEQLRHRLSSHEEPVPDGLWDRIEQQLDASSGKPRRVVPLRWWLAAAAVAVVALIGGGYLYNITKVETTTPLMAEQVKPAASAPVAPAIAPAVPVPVVEQTPLRGLDTKQQEAAAVPAAVDHELASPATETAQEPVPDDTSEQPSADQSSPTVTEPIAKPAVTDDLSVPSSSVRHRQPMRASLMVNNLIAYSGGRSNSVEPMLMSRSYMGHAASLAGPEPIYLTGYSEEAEHRHPLTVGLLLSIPLDENWWVEGGLTYSRLSSTFNHHLRGRVLTDEQRLQYVGVPVGIGRTLWQTGRFQVYASASVAADFNLKAVSETYDTERSLQRDRVQFSVGAHVGATYNIQPWLGLYAQPGLKYYIDNGSQIQNIFKEHPLGFDLQLGLKVNLR
jgi:hypothetical protein